MRIFILSIFVLIATNLQAQKTYQLQNKSGKESYRMTLEDDSPDNVSLFYAGVDLYVSFGNLSMGPGITAEYRPNPKLYVNANTILPYDLLQMGKSVDKTIFEKYKPFSTAGVTASWFFSTREKYKKKKLYFGGHTTAFAEVLNFARITIPKAVKYGIRAGFQHSSMPIGSFLEKYDYSTNAFPQTFQSNVAVIGLVKNNQYQYVASTEEFGVKGGQFINQLYLDALVMVQGKTDYLTEGGSPANYTEVKTKAGKVGWRFGWSFVGGRSPSGFGIKYGLEFGSVPGALKKGSGGFFVFKIGCGLLAGRKNY